MYYDIDNFFNFIISFFSSNFVNNSKIRYLINATNYLKPFYQKLLIIIVLYQLLKYETINLLEEEIGFQPTVARPLVAVKREPTEFITVKTEPPSTPVPSTSSLREPPSTTVKTTKPSRYAKSISSSSSSDVEIIIPELPVIQPKYSLLERQQEITKYAKVLEERKGGLIKLKEANKKLIEDIYGYFNFYYPNDSNSKSINNNYIKQLIDKAEIDNDAYFQVINNDTSLSSDQKYELKLLYIYDKDLDIIGLTLDEIKTVYDLNIATLQSLGILKPTFFKQSAKTVFDSINKVDVNNMYAFLSFYY